MLKVLLFQIVTVSNQINILQVFFHAKVKMFSYFTLFHIFFFQIAIVNAQAVKLVQINAHIAQQKESAHHIVIVIQKNTINKNRQLIFVSLLSVIINVKAVNMPQKNVSNVVLIDLILLNAIVTRNLQKKINNVLSVLKVFIRTSKRRNANLAVKIVQNANFNHNYVQSVQNNYFYINNNVCAQISLCLRQMSQERLFV